MHTRRNTGGHNDEVWDGRGLLQYFVYGIVDGAWFFLLLRSRLLPLKLQQRLSIIV